MYEQLLLNGQSITVYSFQEWFDMFVKHCNKIYFERGDSTGEYCCGYHWCCDECEQELCNGCADCVATIVKILKEHDIKIITSDIDFEKWEKLAEELIK